MRTFAVVAILTVLGCLAVGGDARADGVFLDPVITGAINADGTSQFKTNTFTVSHPSTGNYVLTFAPWVFLNRDPVCIVNPLVIPGLSVDGERLSPNSCSIYIANQSGIFTDTIFVFMAAPATGTPPAQ